MEQRRGSAWAGAMGFRDDHVDGRAAARAAGSRCELRPVAASTLGRVGSGARVRWAHGLLLLCVLVAPAWSQSTITPEQQYLQLIRVNQDVQPLGEHPFGENIGLYNGSLSFEVTDVSASGNGPLLRLVRAFTLHPDVGPRTQMAEPVFSDWGLSLPRIETFVTENGFTYDASTGQEVKFSGWRMDGNSPLRCADFLT